METDYGNKLNHCLSMDVGNLTSVFIYGSSVCLFVFNLF